MKNILPGVWQWSWFSEEKQIDFNGLFLTVGEHKILVDPPPMTGDASAVILRNGPVDYIIVTNRDHVREAVKYQDEFRCQLHVPEVDAPASTLGRRTTALHAVQLVATVSGIHSRSLDAIVDAGEAAQRVESSTGGPRKAD